MARRLLWLAAMRATIPLALLTFATPAVAGSLDKLEKSHQSSSSSSSSSKSSSSSSSDSSSSSSSGSSSSGDSVGSAIAGEVVKGLVSMGPRGWFGWMPPFWGAAWAPPHRPALDPYAGTWVDPQSTTPQRHLEVSVGGYSAREEGVFSRTFGARLFLGELVFGSTWDRMYETPRDGSLSRLDLWHFHASSNLGGGWARNIEIYPLMGAGLLRGNSSHWAFDAGLEMRVYPQRPLLLMASSIASIFAVGPVLFDTRFEAGLVFEHVEVRAGARWMYQQDAQGFLGPTASMAVRF